MNKRSALLLEKMDAGNGGWEKRLAQRLAASLALPGFRFARGFVLTDALPKAFAVSGEAKYLALYDMESTAAARSPAYHDWERGLREMPLRLDRGVYHQIYPRQGEYNPPPTRYLYIAGHEVKRGKTAEYNAWYNTDRHPAMGRVPGFVAVRRFELARGFPLVGDLPRFLVVYDLAAADVLESEAFKTQYMSPWTAWMRGNYTRKMGAIFQRIYP